MNEFYEITLLNESKSKSILYVLYPDKRDLKFANLDVFDVTGKIKSTCSNWYGVLEPLEPKEFLVPIEELTNTVEILKQCPFPIPNEEMTYQFGTPTTTLTIKCLMNNTSLKWAEHNCPNIKIQKIVERIESLATAKT
jgi:hypothetical protein